MWSVRCELLEPPGGRTEYDQRVTVSLTDVDGRAWHFEDKWVIFCHRENPPAAECVIRCELLSTSGVADGREVCTISTEWPDHVNAVDSGETLFRVYREQLIEEPDR